MASGRMGNFHRLTQMKFTDEHKIGQLHQSRTIGTTGIMSATAI